MTRKHSAAGRSKPVAEPEPEPDLELEPQALAPRPDQVMARPDGYYWRTADGKQEFGPFESRESAWADMEAADEEAPEPGESLQEAESEIGIADWIDPETGEPAEGLSPPHFDENQ
jgi:hypothetical protein